MNKKKHKKKKKKEKKNENAIIFIKVILPTVIFRCKIKPPGYSLINSISIYPDINCFFATLKISLDLFAYLINKSPIKIGCS